MLWSGDELGQFNDPNWDTEPGHEADCRWAGRPVLDERAVAQRHDVSTVAGRVFTDLAHMGRVRASLPQLSADVRTQVAPVDDDGVLVTVRDHPRGSFVGVYNVTPDWRSIPASRLADCGVLGAVDALTQTVPAWSTTLEGAGDGMVPVPPYAAWWLVLPLLRRVHGASIHRGKIPRRTGSALVLKHESAELKRKLQEAIESEKYEQAAELRDRIRELENHMAKESES